MPYNWVQNTSNQDKSIKFSDPAGVSQENTLKAFVPGQVIKPQVVWPNNLDTLSVKDANDNYQAITTKDAGNGTFQLT